MPLLLLLQLLALAVLVFALADPASDKTKPGSSTVFVVDESMWMGAEVGAGETRIRTPQAELRERIAACPPTKRCGSSAPTPPRRCSSKVRRRRRSRRSASSRPARRRQPARRAAPRRRTAAGEDSRVVLLRAPKEAAPKVRGGESLYDDVAVGKPVEDAGVSNASAHCDRLGAEECEVFVRITATGGAATSVPVTSPPPARSRRRGRWRSPPPGHLAHLRRFARRRGQGQPAGRRRAGRGRLGLRLGARTGRRADHPGRRTDPCPAARPGARLGPRGETAPPHPAELQAHRSGHQRPARPRPLRPQGRPAEGPGAAPRRPAELPRRADERADEGQPDERLRSGQPAARGDRTRIADDRRERLAQAQPSPPPSAPPPGARKAR